MVQEIFGIKQEWLITFLMINLGIMKQAKKVKDLNLKSNISVVILVLKT